MTCLMGYVQLGDVDVFIDIFGRRINIFGADIAPFEHGLRALFELIFIAENDQRPLG